MIAYAEGGYGRDPDETAKKGTTTREPLDSGTYEELARSLDGVQLNDLFPS
ncbi:hypothetical protein [Streptomyces sp. NPDC006012]|uniref:hypothetical protein n=1 Tax=Streptomyces sp. NPDC006012 TaxID=3364739 RepID=UPI00368F62E3